MSYLGFKFKVFRFRGSLMVASRRYQVIFDGLLPIGVRFELFESRASV